MKKRIYLHNCGELGIDFLRLLSKKVTRTRLGYFQEEKRFFLQDTQFYTEREGQNTFFADLAGAIKILGLIEQTHSERERERDREGERESKKSKKKRGQAQMCRDL